MSATPAIKRIIDGREHPLPAVSELIDAATALYVDADDREETRDETTGELRADYARLMRAVDAAQNEKSDIERALGSLAWVYTHLEHRIGLRERYDLVTGDERNAIADALRAVGRAP